MATEDDLRDAQKQYLAEELALAKAKAWTPSLEAVARLVIDRINDKYAGTKPDVEEAVELVFEVLKSVQRRMIQPGLWASPAAPGPGGFVQQDASLFD